MQTMMCEIATVGMRPGAVDAYPQEPLISARRPISERCGVHRSAQGDGHCYFEGPDKRLFRVDKESHCIR
jgi:hypothetical protein